MLKEYKEVYRMLEDEESRDIYLKRLNWLISGDAAYIDAIVSAYLPEVAWCENRQTVPLKDRMPKDRKIVLYGAGTMGRKLLPAWQSDERFIGFCSQTKEKQEQGYCGWPVMSPEELLARKDLSVCISTTRAYEEIKRILEEGGYPQDQVYASAEYYFEDPGQYFAPDFIEYEDEEVFIDVGCCDLNSTLELFKRCKHLKKVYALEPDPESYRVCQEKRERFHMEQVKLLPFGAWNEHTTLRFSATNDGVSHVSENGEIVIPVIRIDEIIMEESLPERVTMIKMDIEGSELAALEGAKAVIQRDKPKLAICIYHKPEDMTEIPLYIKKLVPEYRLFIRHHSSGAAETVLYAVMP